MALHFSPRIFLRPINFCAALLGEGSGLSGEEVGGAGVVAEEESAERVDIEDLAGDKILVGANGETLAEHGAAGLPFVEPLVIGGGSGDAAIEFAEEDCDDAETVEEIAGGLVEGGGARGEVGGEVGGGL
jgi:hypothetical protein